MKKIEDIWDQVKGSVFNNIKLFLLKNKVSEILTHFMSKIDKLVFGYAKRLPRHVAESERDDLRTLASLELLETFKAWVPSKSDNIWPLAQMRIVGAMKDHIRHITRTDPTRIYEWVSDAAYMYMTVNKQEEFSTKVERGDQLNQLLKVLSEREKQVVLAHTKEDKTFKEIGDLICVSESQTSRIYNKALKTMRKELEKHK
jgi:RNA polymerase sigma factor (sigma-70 family)